jgi:GT2 family glycosyltransferase
VPVRDRTAHLANLVDGLTRSADAPRFELVVGWIGGENPRPALDRARGFAASVIEIETESEELPPGLARNQLAAAASGELLVFLDVDCIPSRALLAAHAAALYDHDALAVGDVRYLPKGFQATGANELLLRRAGHPHPDRAGLFPAPGVVRTDDRHALFRSLNFAVRRATFIERIGGFDGDSRAAENEDARFGLRAARAGVPVAWVGGALAFHQHHAPARPRSEASALR